MIMAAHQRIRENQKNPINPIYWHSKKIQRVAISTLSAEAMALAGAVDSLSGVRLYWAWLIGTRSDWCPPDEEEETSAEIFPSNYQIILERNFNN